MRRTLLIAAGVGALIATPGMADEIATLPSPENPDINIGVFRSTVPIAWRNAKNQIEAFGGFLFAPQSESDRAVVEELVATLGPWECIGPWLGVQRVPSTKPLDTGWADIHGLPVANVPWSADQPYGSHVFFWSAAVDAREETYDTWVNILPDPDAGAPVFGYVFLLEGSFPDCDGDGIPNHLEIELLGESDSDSDGTPDVCAIPGDINGDGKVDGMDLAIILSTWGPCAASLPCPGDLSGDGTVDGHDIGLLLGFWTG